MESTVDSTFIRRAVEVADLNAVRVALYQQTGDPELAQLPTTANLDEAQRELLISKAVAWLEQNAGPVRLAEPPEDELRTLMNMATAEEMGDLEFEARRDLPAFKEFPWTASGPTASRSCPRVSRSPSSAAASAVSPWRSSWNDWASPTWSWSGAASRVGSGPSIATRTSASTPSPLPTSSASRRTTSGMSTSGAGPRSAPTSTMSRASTASTSTRCSTGT